MSAKAKRKSSKITRGALEVTVYPHPKGWRFAWRRGGSDPWQYTTRSTKQEAEEAAWIKLGELASSESLQWSTLSRRRREFLQEIHESVPEGEEHGVLSYLRSRSKSAEVGAAVERFAEWKAAADGELTPHMRRVLRCLRTMAKDFSGRRVADIEAAELAQWWTKRGDGLSDKSKHDLRAHLVAFWRWCLREHLAGTDPVTVAERIPPIGTGKGERQVWTAHDLRRLLASVDTRWRVWVVLGAFAGMRPEEVSPPTKGGAKKRHKRGLHCEDIDWTFGAISIPPEVSKVDTPRRVPFNEALRAGLAWAGIEPGMTGPVCPVNPAEDGELKRLGKVLFGAAGWPRNALRHSYGSYRNAIIRDLPRLAEEMGTSVAMLHRNYHNPQPDELGREWFGVDFSQIEVPTGSDFRGVKDLPRVRRVFRNR